LVTVTVQLTYTTSISKIDPFTKLDKLKIAYLKSYENIILDPEAPLELPEEPHLSVCANLLKSSLKNIRRLPFFIGLIAYVPIGIITVLINSGIEALSSSRRIRLYEQGLSDIQPGTYRVPLLITELQEAMDDAYKNINSAQSNEYLASDVDEEAAMGRNDFTSDYTRRLDVRACLKSP
jgi:hypothetical protein